MNIENCISESHLDPEKNLKESWNEEGNQFIGDGLVINGISNGYTEKHLKKDRPPDYKEKHKEKHKDGHKEHREKDREKERDKHRDKDRHSSSSKDKDKHSSSSSKDKDRKHKDERRDKERHERKDVEKHERKDGERHERRDGERHEKKDGERHERKDGDKHEKKHSEKHERRDGDKHERKEGEKHERKEGDKHGHDKKDIEKHQKKDGEKHEKKDRDREKEKKDRDDRKDKERDRDREDRKDKDREHKSSSSKDKEHRSSSSSKDKEKYSSSSNDKSSSSNKDRDKDKTSSSSKDKHSNRDKHSEKKHSEKEKEKHKSREKDLKEKSKHKESEIVTTELKEHSNEYSTTPDIKVELKEESSFSVEEVKKEPGDTEESFYNYSAFSQPSMSASQIKAEEDSDDDIPLAVRSVKRHMEESDEEDVPLLKRQKIRKEKSKKRKAESDEEEFTPEKKSKAKNKVKNKVKLEKVKKEKVKTETEAEIGSPRKKKKEEEKQEVWKWWEEEKRDDGVKWTTLEHKGPVFAPAYERLPRDVKFFYDGKEMRLSEETEEVATFYARMLDHDYTTKEAFNKNFFKDWRKVMTSEEKELIKDLSKCNFKHMHAYFVQKSEERKAMSKEEKKKIKEQNEELIKEYGFCTIDGHKERIGNFKLEPPGLFRGRGEHPKMGMLKKRLMPEEIIINCSKNSNIPKPPAGHRWKEVRHDQTVTWLVSWTENIQGSVKYIMLNPSSKLKGEKDWQKYETARKLHKSIDKIRREYREDWKSKEMRIRQRSVALYFIDKLALRAGNEKDEDQADTVGCCSLRVEHIGLHEEKDGKENVVVFDFLGKDSIRYYNEVSVERRVFKNLQLFMQNKSTGDDLFDRLNTTVLNKHLNELMEGLTAKVFRTYNASITLQQQLDALTDPEYTVQEKILAYNRANRAVAILCNHQRAVPKTHAKSMENLKGKIEAKRQVVEDAERQYKDAKREAKHSSSAKSKMDMDKRKKALERLREQLAKLELQATDKEENKEIALGTSKLNYLDPRISVAWCKKHDVPIEKIYNKTQREKFRWAIDMAGSDYVF